MYSEEADPWRVGSSWYEQRKMSVVLAALSDPTYRRVLDPACGTGHLALQLGARCGEVVARDASAAAVELARATCAEAPGVRVDQQALPYGGGDPAGPFDLIVLSEFLYYLDADQRVAAIESVLVRAAPRVEVVAVHWREQPEDGTASGDLVHEQVRDVLRGKGFRHQVALFDEEFVLDVLTRGHDRHTE